MTTAERPNFEAQKPLGTPGAPEAMPLAGNSTVNVASEAKKESSEPSNSQIFFRDMYRTGNLSPYQKDRPSINWKIAGEAWENPQSQGTNSRIMALDLALRGGADKPYNQLGDMGHRALRMTVMAANVVPFTIFDIVTSIPGNLFLEGVKLNKDNHKKLREGNAATDEEKNRAAVISGLLDGPRRGLEIANDKFTTALGDRFVQMLTGEKGQWIREPSDKMGDFLDGSVGMYAEDAVNGPIVESTMRLLYNIPVAGAIIEQGWTKLAKWQESSPFTKATGKAVFGGLGIMIGTVLSLKETDKKTQAIKQYGDPGYTQYYKEPSSPSKMISVWAWNKTPWGK